MMKKTMFLLGGLIIGLSTSAQVKTPQLSPAAKIGQTVGLTKFEVNYSRPSLRGRDMHKEIIPYGNKWRFGANKSTTISFDTDINFGGEQVASGTYEMYAIPNEGKWELILYAGKDNWGVPKKWEADKVVAELAIPVKKSEQKVETFTLSFDDLTVDHFVLNVAWENTILPIKVELPTRKIAVSSIEKTMKGKPSERDFYSAASYYLAADMKLNHALKYVNQAIEMNEDAPFYYIRNKALIQAAMKDYKGAIETAEKSLKMAEKAGSKEYIRKNKASIKEWKSKL